MPETGYVRQEVVSDKEIIGMGIRLGGPDNVSFQFLQLAGLNVRQPTRSEITTI